METSDAELITLSDEERWEHLSRRMESFIDYFEMAEQKMVTWQNTLEEQIQAQGYQLQKKFEYLNQVLEELKNVLGQSGFERWRMAAESLMEHSQTQFSMLENATQEFMHVSQQMNEEMRQLAEQSFERLDRASAYAVKNISEAVNSFKVEEIQRFAMNSCEAINKTCDSTLSSFRAMMRKFHWKNLSLALLITVCVAIVIGLYLEDELPWERHTIVVAERNAGQALLSAWPTLSSGEKKDILAHVAATPDGK